jgi:hypothetical protein
MSQAPCTAALVRLNIRLLRQAAELLETIDEAAFLTPPPNGGSCCVSSQMRHVIEFYECFLAGLDSVHIDYDARRRDPALEASRDAAVKRIRSLVRELSMHPALAFDNVLFVRAEDAEGLGLHDPFLMSTVSRELLALSSHTTHHYALIAMTLRLHGVSVQPDFGVAPSTLQNRGRAGAIEHEAA